PLLYQVATGFLDPSAISYPFRKLFRDRRIQFRMAEVRNVNLATKTLQLDNGTLGYDYLVFACGAHTNFYGIESVRQNAISLKNIDDALVMRNELIKALEKASIEKDPDERRRLLTFVVAGGGPTGVELAGMLAEMRDFMFNRDYPELKGAPGGIYLVDGGKSLLAPMSEATHRETYNIFKKLGVKVMLESRVTDYTDGIVTFKNGETIETRSLIWAAGIIANTFTGIPQQCLGPGQRMITDEFGQVKGLQDVFAVGDISIQFTDPAYPSGHPQLAQYAIQTGKTLAKNFKRQAKNRPLKAFKYFDRGEMAVIGRNRAVADLLKHHLHLKGILALAGWLFIHLISLVNYNNKVKTLYSWIVAYLTRDQALRMIVRIPPSSSVPSANAGEKTQPIQHETSNHTKAVSL
ncbi:MAG TPA: NAD(P)/FAD-dependent oxidoreductase, partial [Puia sp.]